jgi:carbonic anhydrase
MRRTFLLDYRVLSLSLLATFVSVPAHAAKWQTIDSKGNVRIEVDLASIERENGDKMRVWHRETYKKPQIPDTGAFSYGSLTALTEFQCAKRLATPQRSTYFAPDGSELKTENYDSKEALPVAPDSIIETVLLKACKPKPSPAAASAAQPAVAEPIPAASPADSRSNKKSKAAKEEAVHHEDPHWTYEGKTGAAKWGKMSDKFAVCSTGQRQSPIDIREAIRADLPPLEFAYKPLPLSIIDNGHTVQVNTAGAGSITVEGESFELLQFHFHKPSEERINGKTYDMVVHLVHKSKDNRLAVVAVMLQAGQEHKLIRTLWSNLPLEQNKAVLKPDIAIDPSLLLPKTRSYYTFMGSLTTPPCSEGVLWLVLKTPVELSREQIADFGKLYVSNARPVQPRNARVIKGAGP